jgi:hypothetical protein
MDTSLATTPVAEAFLAPALRLVRDYCRSRRDTPALGDEPFVAAGLHRVLGQFDSGRDFLQATQERGTDLARATWFDALHSVRRGGLLGELAHRSYAVWGAALRGRDWLGAYPELRGRTVWAVDGHQLAHACHAARDAKGAHVPVGLLFGLCLHSGLLRPLAPFQGDGVHRHEFPVFCAHWPRWLAQDRGTLMPLAVVDPAYVDVLYWSEQHRLGHSAMITREKENMKPRIVGPHPFDRADPVNRGVEADEFAGYTHAHLRRIVYRDPASGARFVFLTTERSLRPGVIALLYLLRWKIEKAYDVTKNKLHQQKAWANGPAAAAAQAHFVALAHNLLVLQLAELAAAGVTEEKTAQRQAAGRAATPPDRRVPAQERVRHARQLTCQFIRLVRHCLRYPIPWREAFPAFQRRLQFYL